MNSSFCHSLLLGSIIHLMCNIWVGKVNKGITKAIKKERIIHFPLDSPVPFLLSVFYVQSFYLYWLKY